MFYDYYSSLGRSEANVVVEVVVVDLESVAPERTPPSTLSPGGRIEKPKVPRPQTWTFFLSLRPSPNSSFHFRRSARVPSDSDADGVISFNAFVKLCARTVRRGLSGLGGPSDSGVSFVASFVAESEAVVGSVETEELGASSEDAVGSLEGVVEIEVTSACDVDGVLAAAQGTVTCSLTASSAADTQRSVWV
jgi:hypothetical protein